MFDNSQINQVQQATDIVDIIAEHVSLAKKGTEMVGLCPFHDDHSPSMFVNSTKQIFKCFACGAGGGVFTFVQMRENLTFPQAVERLAQRAGIKLKPTGFTKSRSNAQPDVDPNRLAKVNTWAAEYFQNNLQHPQKGKSARDYLAKRQITPDAVKKWQIGLSLPQDDLVKTATARKIPTDLLLKAGLITANNRDKFVNRLMFTITDVTGRIIGFGGRTLNNDGPKYMNSPTTPLFDKSNSLYGLNHARHSIVATGTAVIVEGYTDCIMADIKDCPNVVATLGTSFTAGHARILKRYAKKIVLIFDSDTAGLEAANRALGVCLTQHIDIKLASVPQEKDPCDFLLAAGKEPFEKLINEAVDVFQFKWNRLMESFVGEDTLTDRKQAIEEYLQSIATSLQAGNLSLIDRGLIVNRLSKIIGVGPKEINDDLHKRIQRAAKAPPNDHQSVNVPNTDLGHGLFAAAQQEILEVLLNEPNLFEIVKKNITADMFDVPILRQIAQIVFESLNKDVNTTLTTILAKTESAEISAIMVKLAQTGEQKANFKSCLTAAVDVAKRILRQGQTTTIKSIENQNQFLRHVCETTDKKNRHNLGMT